MRVKQRKKKDDKEVCQKCGKDSFYIFTDKKGTHFMCVNCGAVHEPKVRFVVEGE